MKIPNTETIPMKYNNLSFYHCTPEEDNMGISLIQASIRWSYMFGENDCLTALVQPIDIKNNMSEVMPLFCSHRAEKIFISDNGWILSRYSTEDQQKLKPFLSELAEFMLKEDNSFSAHVKPDMGVFWCIYEILSFSIEINNAAKSLGIQTLPHKDAESIVADSINNTYVANESFDDLDEGFVLTDESNNVIVDYIEGKKSIYVAEKEENLQKTQNELTEKGIKCITAKISDYESLVYDNIFHNGLHQVVKVDSAGYQYMTKEHFLGWDADYIINNNTLPHVSAVGVS